VSKAAFSKQAGRILLLTGVPGIGKTTVVRKLIELLPEQRLGGFYTAEIRTEGVRQGFDLIPVQGAKRIIAHVDFPKEYRVGKYGVDVAAIDAAASEALAVENDVALYLVDEIGKMECLSNVFIAAMNRLLASDRQVVATIAKKGGGYIEQIKQRRDIKLWELTRENRDRMPEAVLDWLQGNEGGASVIEA